MIKNKKKLLSSAIAVAVLAAAILVFGAASAGAPEPGSPEDPLIPKSYFDAQMSVLMQEIFYLQDEVASLKEQLGDGTAPTASGFKVLELSAGQTLVAGEGTEIVLRSGKAEAISGKNGDGLADVTSGLGTSYDLKTGNSIPVNHLLIVSRDDGRGIKVLSEKAYVLIKGPYSVQP